jgi:hypothetical protein
MAEGVRRTAGAVFSVSLPFAITFWIVKGTQPSGHAVLWVLYGILIASGFIWLMTTFLLRRHSAREKESLTPLEQWLQERVRAARTIERQRPVRGDKWYLRRMEQWDTKNAWELMLGPSRAPELVDSYRAEDTSRPDQVDGVGPPHGLREHERYYRRRLDWLEQTFKRLRKGESAS